MVSEAKYEECGNEILGFARCVEEVVLAKAERIIKVLERMHEMGLSTKELLILEK